MRGHRAAHARAEDEQYDALGRWPGTKLNGTNHGKNGGCAYWAITGTLSGGEQQMLAIGRCLVLRPTVIMLDEPSLGLAPKIAKGIFESIQKLNSEGMTIIVVEQNARRGLECSDWGCVLDLGINRFEGPAQNILDNPQIQELYLGRKAQDRREGGA